MPEEQPSDVRINYDSVIRGGVTYSDSEGRQTATDNSRYRSAAGTSGMRVNQMQQGWRLGSRNMQAPLWCDCRPVRFAPSVAISTMRDGLISGVSWSWMKLCDAKRATTPGSARRTHSNDVGARGNRIASG
jgi:hypothetical protein